MDSCLINPRFLDSCLIYPRFWELLGPKNLFYGVFNPGICAPWFKLTCGEFCPDNDDIFLIFNLPKPLMLIRSICFL